MEKYRSRLLLLLATLVATSCVSELDRLLTREVRFGTTPGYASGVATRTIYTGVDEEGNSISVDSHYERIDWLSTDVIRIVSPEAATASSTSPQHYADYSVTPGDVTRQKHNATLAPHDGNGLNWSEEPEHHFYAIYPSPIQNDLAGIVLNEDEFIATASGYVPRDQDGTLDGYTYKPDMDYAYMYAQNTTRESSQVSLTFYALVTTFEFTLLAADDDMAAKTLASVSLSSEEDGAKLCGVFGAEVSPSGLGAVTATGTTGTSVSLDLSGLPDGGVKLSRSTPYTFTLFTMPFAQTKLTLRLSFKDGTTRSLALKDAGAWITVPARSKVYFRNLGVPGADWVYTIDPLQSVTLGYTGGSSQLSNTTTFKSIRTKGTVTEEVPYKLQYSEDNGNTWTDGLPDWLDATSPSSYGGSTTGETLTLTMEAQENSALEIDPHHIALAAKDGTVPPYFDLSTVNVSTGTPVSTSTANCYVVQAPGTYKFPVVYGNALRNGTVNEESFRARDGLGGSLRPDEGVTNFLGRFKDHLDQSIMTPYIGVQHSSATLSAVLLWEDAQGLVTEVNITGSGQDAYITFEVPADNITQGNAVIAVLTDGVIAWSWHIWITEEDLTILGEVSNGFKMPHVNIGWCERRTMERYLQRTCLVRAVQTVPEGVASPAVTIKETGGEVIFAGNNPFYQWGRKDPLQAGKGYSQNKPYYPSSAAYAPRHVSTKASVGTAIQNPNEFYNVLLNNWCNTNFYNLWSSTNNGIGLVQNANARTKTVYDPSPVGFRVPAQNAWDGFYYNSSDDTNFPAGTRNGELGRTYGSLFFPATGLRMNMAGRDLWNINIQGHYWSSVAENEGRTAFTLQFYPTQQTNTDLVKPDFAYHFSYGLPVRPIQDDAMLPHQIGEGVTVDPYDETDPGFGIGW